MDKIELAEALELFKLPRTLGTTSAGEPIITNVGRFGPYIKYGDKYVSLKDDDPYTVSHERALECIRAKQEADANRLIQQFDGVQVLNGRYGPYISDGEKNARVPKDRDPRSLTLEECRSLLAAAAARPMRGRFGRRAAGKSAAASPAAAGSKRVGASSGASSTKARKGKAAEASTRGNGRGGNSNGHDLAAADSSSKKARSAKAGRAGTGTRAPADKSPVAHAPVRKVATHPHTLGTAAAGAAAKRAAAAKTKAVTRGRSRAAAGKKTAGA
jgi:DNA topoisomerase-1